MSAAGPSRFARGKALATRHWRALKARHGWLRHIVAAWAQLRAHNGTLYAAAITYFSFLALFPLLLLAVAVTGFVLHAHPAAQASLLDNISRNVPGSFGTTLQSAVRTAIKARTGVGVIALVGVLFTGLGWVSNLRAAIVAVWGHAPLRRNPVMAKLVDLGVLVGLGIGMLASLAFTTAGTALTDQLVRGLGLAHVDGIHELLAVAGIALGLVGDCLIFWWLIVRLPAVRVPRGVAIRGALLAAVGFEILKIVGTVTIAKTSHSPTAGPFAGVVAILVWLQLVSRFLLFAVAWTATAEPTATAESADAVGVPVREAAGKDQAEPEHGQPDA